MKVREMIELLSECHPEEPISFLSPADRHMTFVGIDGAMSEKEGCVSMRFDWSAGNKVEESYQDQLRRQRDALTREIGRINERAKEREAQERKVEEKRKELEAQEAKRAAAKKTARKTTKKKKSAPKKNRTPAEQIADGFVPTGQRGRPRKMIDDPQMVMEFLDTK